MTLVTVLLAYPMAYFVAFRVERTKFLWLILLTIPFWTSYLLRVFAWKIILGYNGVINSGLMALGIIHQPLEFLLYKPIAVVVTLAHAWAPFAILPIYVSLEKIDRSLLEAAADLGDGPVRRFFRITLPLSLPGVIGAAVLIFVPTTGDYVTPALVGGTGRRDDRQCHRGAVHQGRQLAAGRGAGAGQHGGRGRGHAADRAGDAHRRGEDEMMARRSTKAGSSRGLLAYAVFYLAFLYVPVLFLPLFSFNNSAFIAFPLVGFTTKWYGQMLADTAMHHALWNSLKVGSFAGADLDHAGPAGGQGADALPRAGRRRRAGLHQPAAVHSRHRAGHFAADPDEHGAHAAVACERGGGPCADLRAVCA